MERILYVVYAVWATLFLAYAISLAMFLTKFFKAGGQMPRLNDMKAVWVFWRSFPRTMNILWWVVLCSTIIVAALNTAFKK